MSATHPRNRKERRELAKAQGRDANDSYRRWKRLAKGVHHPSDIINMGRGK